MHVDGTLLGTTPVSGSWVSCFAAEAAYEFQSGAGQVATFTLIEQDGSAYVPGDRAAPLGYPDFSGQLEIEVQTETTKTGDKLKVTTFEMVLGPTTNVDQAPYQGRVYASVSAVASLDLVDGRVRAVPRSIYGFQDVTPEYNDGLLVPLAPPIGPFLPGEVLLRFRTYMRQLDTADAAAEAIDCALPQEFISWFASNAFTVQSEALLLRYRNTLTGQLLFECKLYSEGYIALSYPGSGPLTFPTDGFFEVVSWVPRLYQLASVGSLATGRTLKQ